MKTIKCFGWLILVVGLLSCSTNYRMVTRVHKSGKVEREVYALADSIFMAGDVAHNPFLFSLNDWKVERMDSIAKYDFWGSEEKLNVKVSRALDTSGELAFFSDPNYEWMKPLAIPHEKLEKKFRWFYTYYVFTSDYHELPYKGPVPIDKYLNKNDQMLFFQGDLNVCPGMNGLELKDKLDDLANNFQNWLYQSQYEISYKIVEHLLEKAGDTISFSRVCADKDSVRALSKPDKDNLDCNPRQVCSLLDKYYGTGTFTSLYEKEGKKMDQMYEDECVVMNLFEYQIKYELTMPGKVLSANTALQSGNKLVWKVNAYRLLPGNYTLKAESRVPNVWAFVLSGLLILFAAYCLFRKR